MKKLKKYKTTAGTDMYLSLSAIRREEEMHSTSLAKDDRLFAFSRKKPKAQQISSENHRRGRGARL